MSVNFEKIRSLEPLVSFKSILEMTAKYWGRMHLRLWVAPPECHGVAERKRLDLGNLNPIYERDLTS